MTESEWLTCGEPDLLLEQLMGKVSHEQLVTFVRQCWDRIKPYKPSVPHEFTVVEQFAEAVERMSNHDAAIYASEAALKAAGLAPNRREEQWHQAKLLRQIVSVYFAPMPMHEARSLETSSSEPEPTA
jgi:hypothetical protein